MKTIFLTSTAIGILAASTAFSTGITTPTFERPRLIAPERAPKNPNPDCPHKHISADCDPDRPAPREPECTMLWTPGTQLAIREKECA